MARIRTIKPRMFKSFTVSAYPFEARWLFAGLFTYCDDYGRGVDDTRLVKAELFALDDKTTAARIERFIAVMATGDDAPLCRYTADDGRTYLHFPKWKEHQRISHPTDSELPPCPVHGGKDFRSGSGIVPEPSANESEKPSAGMRNEEVEGNEEVDGIPQAQVPNARRPLKPVANASPGMAQLGDALGLVVNR